MAGWYDYITDMAIRKFRIEDFYDFHPDGRFVPGDIWSDLPSFGVLQSHRVRGVVITPSCDLANAKTETVSYLPIVPILSYFAIPAGLPKIGSAQEFDRPPAGNRFQEWRLLGKLAVCETRI
jgi:hypothetical protein